MQLTRFLVIGLLFLACGAGGQSLVGTNRVVRLLSLTDCIQEALQHNLLIQVERYNPNVSRYTLAASYGVYDPVFTTTYDRSYHAEEGSFDPSTGTLKLANKTDTDRLNGGLVGDLPTGMHYELGVDYRYERGRESRLENYRADANIALTQPLLKNFWIDLNRLNIKLNKLNIKSSEFTLEDIVRQVVRDVQVAYYELIFAQDDLKVQEKGLELADALAAQNREKVRVGTLAPLDQRQAESQAAAARADLIQAQRRLVVAENTLKNLITDSYGAWINTALQPTEKLVAVPELLSLQESWSTAFTKRPDYLAKVLEGEKQGLTVKYQYNQLFPELNLAGGYGRNGLVSSRRLTIASNDMTGVVITNQPYNATPSGPFKEIWNGDTPSWNAGVILSVPLSRKADRNNYKEAKEIKKQIDVQIRMLFQDIQVEVENTIVQAKGEYERVGATREARIYAEEALAAEQTKLENGKSTSFNVLQLQRDLTTARSLEIRALANYNQALALLYYRDGTVLERAKVSVVK